MLSYFLAAVVPALIVFFFMLYHYEIKAPVDNGTPDRPRDFKYEWFDFIRANIQNSFTAYHCHQCRKMIVLFDQRFRKEVAPDIFNDWINTLYNILDTKYKILAKEDEELSSLSSENVLNILI